MKVLHVITGLVLLGLLFCGSLFAVYTAFQAPAAWPAWMQSLAGVRLELIMVSLSLLFLTVIYALSGLSAPARVQYLAYDIEGGAVSISLRAIQDLVARLADEFAAIVSLQPTIRAVNAAVDVQLDVKVKAGAKIPELCKMLQERTKETILQNVGISDVQEIRVRIQEIVMASPAAPASDTKVGMGAGG
ncbi:MAG TPA: alkaline shock response membrane anchor protein AmaP [Kiritimatiellia bacterium]|jgi:hypothetical protein